MRRMLLIKDGHVVDPRNNVDGISDILIEDGKVMAVGKGLQRSGGGRPGGASKTTTRGPALADRVLDARDKVVIPGLIDMHVHLREPGREDEETIASGTAAAARGGFTSICCMPNTAPVNDTASVTEYILEQAKRHGCVHVFPIGCITRGQKGEALAEIGELVQAGCVGISDDGLPVTNAEVMRRAMEYATMFDIPVISHCEDTALAAGGVMHEGVVSTELGLRGIPGIAEAAMVTRDVLLAEFTGARLHVCHVSAKESIRALREGKARGLPVSGEATPHHLVLTDEAVRGFDTNTKMNPPLRAQEDVEALREALADGTIEVIATDHAPHARAEKEQEYDNAPFGIVGLETCLALILTEFFHTKRLSLTQIVERMALHPARILRLAEKGHLGVGADADVTIIDPDRKWTVQRQDFKSKSANSPFIGRTLAGTAVATIVSGRVVWEAP